MGTLDVKDIKNKTTAFCLAVLGLIAGWSIETQSAADFAALYTPIVNIRPGEGQGQTVYASGLAQGGEQIKDDIFPITSQQALAVRRTVKMYAWQAKTHYLRGGDRQFELKMDWVDWPQTPARMELTTEQRAEVVRNPNPTMPFGNRTRIANRVTLDGWRLDPDLIDSLPYSQPVDVTKASLPHGWRAIDGHTIYFGGDPANPKIGDLRVAFTSIPAADYSLITQARGNSLIAPLGQDLKPGILFAQGRISRDAMLAGKSWGYHVRDWGQRILIIAIIASSVGWMIMLNMLPRRLREALGEKPWPLVVCAAPAYGVIAGLAWSFHLPSSAVMILAASILTAAIPIVWLSRSRTAQQADSPVFRRDAGG